MSKHTDTASNEQKINELVNKWYEARKESETKKQFEKELEDYIATIKAQARQELAEELMKHTHNIGVIGRNGLREDIGFVPIEVIQKHIGDQ